MGRNSVAILPDATFIIGYTGGWRGGATYKLEEGLLHKSVEQRGLGAPPTQLAFMLSIVEVQVRSKN